MELKKVLIGLEGLKAKGNLDVEINNLDSNSKNIKEGDMFVAIKGFSTDGSRDSYKGSSSLWIEVSRCYG